MNLWLYDRWGKDGFPKVKSIYLFLSFLLLIFFVFFNLTLPNISKNAQILSVLISLITFFCFGKKVRNTFPVYLLLAAIIVQVVSWVFGYFDHPEWVNEYPKVDRLGRLFIFIFFAWALGGSTSNTIYLWVFAALGILTATLVDGNINNWIIGFKGARVDFHIRNAQHIAMYFGTMLLGLIFLSFRAFFKDRKFIFWRFLVWLFFVAIIMLGVIITQTRAVWFAVIVSIGVVSLTMLFFCVYKGRYNKSYTYILLAFIFLSFLGSFFIKDIVIQRLQSESSIVSLILEKGIAEVPYTSIGIRIQTWRAATEWIAERPIIGWGDEGRSLVIKETVWLPEFVRVNFGHLHNYFLEVWVAYGLLGLLVIAALAFWVGRGVLLAWKKDLIPTDIMAFSVAFFIFWVIVNQFESYSSFSSGIFVFNVVLAGVVTHVWRINYINKI